MSDPVDRLTETVHQVQVDMAKVTVDVAWIKRGMWVMIAAVLTDVVMRFIGHV